MDFKTHQKVQEISAYLYCSDVIHQVVFSKNIVLIYADKCEITFVYKKANIRIHYLYVFKNSNGRFEFKDFRLLKKAVFEFLQ